MMHRFTGFKNLAPAGALWVTAGAAEASLSLCRSTRCFLSGSFSARLPNLCSARPPSESMNHVAAAASTAPLPLQPDSCYGNRHKQAPTDSQCARPSGCHPFSLQQKSLSVTGKSRPRPQTLRLLMKTCRGCLAQKHISASSQKMPNKNSSFRWISVDREVIITNYRRLQSFLSRVFNAQGHEAL